jgi:hypothetical protein
MANPRMSVPLVPSFSRTAPQSLPPNRYDRLLDSDTGIFRDIAEAGGLKALCCPTARNWDKPPYLVMPEDARQFTEINSIALPAPGAAEQTVTEMVTPTGYAGVITSVVNYWTGAGFTDGSGDLIWRIRIGPVYARDFGEILTALGSLTSPCTLFRGGLRLRTFQRVQYRFQHSALSGLAGGRIVCGFLGWFYPTS